MDQSELDTLVHTVLQQMGYGATPAVATAAATPAASIAPACPPVQAASAVAADDALPDLGADDIKYWIGVKEPHNLQVLKELRKGTEARVCVGRTGPRPRTTSLLRFLADHSRSKDTVLKEVPEEWVKTLGLLEVRS